VDRRLAGVSVSVWDHLERLARFRLRLAGVGGRMLDDEAGSVHVYDAAGAGPRPTTLLLHGIGSSATAYGKLVLGLVPRVERVLAPDLPGHGFSAAPGSPPSAAELARRSIAIVDRVLEPVTEPVVVIGTSMGGALALRYALARPERVGALVLCSPAGAPLDGAALQRLRADFAMDHLDDARAFVDRLFARPPPARGLIARAVHDRLSRPIVQDLLAGVGPDDFLDVRQAASLAPPTLLLWGTAERVLPDSCLTWFRAHLPDGVHIERPEGWGHSAHLEQTAALVDRICGFVDRVLPGSEAPSDGESCPEPAGEAPSGSRL